MSNFKTQRKEDESREINEENQQYYQELYNIGQMKTFYLEEWRPEKLQKNEDNQTIQPKEQFQKQVQEFRQKKKLIIKGLYPKKKSISLPAISNIAMPWKYTPIIKTTQKAKLQQQISTPLDQDYILFSKQLHSSEIEPLQMSLNKRSEIQKKIMSQVKNQIQKTYSQQKNLSLRKKTVEQEFDERVLQTKKISNAYSQRDQRNEKAHHKSRPKLQSKEPIQLYNRKANSSVLSKQKGSRVMQILRQYQKKHLQNNLSSKNKIEQRKILQQRESISKKTNPKRDTLIKLLKKYNSDYCLSEEKRINLKQMEKSRRKQLRRGLSSEKKSLSSHSEFQNYVDFKLAEGNNMFSTLNQGNPIQK